MMQLILKRIFSVFISVISLHIGILIGILLRVNYYENIFSFLRKILNTSSVIWMLFYIIFLLVLVILVSLTLKRINFFKVDDVLYTNIIRNSGLLLAIGFTIDVIYYCVLKIIVIANNIFNIS